MKEITVRQSRIPTSLALLSPRDRRICAEFLLDRDIRGAAQRAGLKVDKLTTVFLQGLKKRLSPFINAYEDEILVSLEVSNQRIMDEVALLAFHDPKNLFERNHLGHIVVKDFDELGEMSRCIAGVERIINLKDQTETLKVKLYSKDAALEKLMRARGMFKDSPGVGVALQLNLDFGAKGA